MCYSYPSAWGAPEAASAGHSNSHGVLQEILRAQLPQIYRSSAARPHLNLPSIKSRGVWRHFQQQAHNHVPECRYVTMSGIPALRLVVISNSRSFKLKGSAKVTLECLALLNLLSSSLAHRATKGNFDYCETNFLVSPRKLTRFGADWMKCVLVSVDRKLRAIRCKPMYKFLWVPNCVVT